jgi:hypothetical protein
VTWPCQPFLVNLFQSSMPLAPIPVEARGSMTRKLTAPAHSTSSSFLPLAKLPLPPKLHPHPEQKGCSQADAKWDEYLWLRSQPWIKEASNDTDTNCDPHSGQIGPDDKQGDCHSTSDHDLRVSDGNQAQQGGSMACPVCGDPLHHPSPKADSGPTARRNARNRLPGPRRSSPG